MRDRPDPTTRALREIARRDPRREAEILAVILKGLRALGIPHWRQNTGQLTTEGRTFRAAFRGCPDILGILPGALGRGRFLAIEVKSQRGTLTREQAMFLQVVNESGGVGFVARSWADVLDGLSAAGWCYVCGPEGKVH